MAPTTSERTRTWVPDWPCAPAQVLRPQRRGAGDPTQRHEESGRIWRAMRTPEGGVVTAHSLNPVPLLIAGAAVEGRQLDDGVLADVAPTIAALTDLEPWPGMTGRSLVRD